MSLVRCLAMAVMVVLIGSCILVTPYGTAFEYIGLNWLFKLRGPIVAPDDVVVITVDQQSARELLQPGKLRNWDRGLHARLVERLAYHSVSVIVFDVFFESERNLEQDNALSKAIEKAGNVVLFQQTIRDRRGDSIINPYEKIASSASVLAPFPLPKIPTKVNYFWPFYQILQTDQESARLLCHAPTVEGALASEQRRSQKTIILDVTEAATIPMATFLLQTIRSQGYKKFKSEMLKLGYSGDPFPRQLNSTADYCNLIDQLRTGFKNDQRSHRAIGSHKFQSDQYQALIELLSETQPLNLNYYGPPTSIRTIRYATLFDEFNQLRDDLLEEFTGKVVFIGGGDLSPVDQIDGFSTVFTTDQGLDINGVEIAATALANMFHGQLLSKASPVLQLTALAFFALTISLLAGRISGLTSIAITLCAGIAYLALTHYLFGRYYFWLPFMVPLLVILPLVLVISQAWKYLISKKKSDQISQSMLYYLPEKAAQELDQRDPTREAELIHGVCLRTDIQNFTSISENAELIELVKLKNEYFEVLNAKIIEHKGEALHIEGDSITALWIDQQQSKQGRLNACLSGLDIVKTVKNYNQSHDWPLITRIGLLDGAMAVGNVGGSGHYTYSVTGDVINTASRIENLNNHLGTSILCGQSTIQDLNELLVRNVGEFLFKGKSDSVIIYELLGVREQCDEKTLDLVKHFEQAITAFNSGAWASAGKLFNSIVRDRQDGVSQFYADLCAGYENNSMKKEAGRIIKMKEK